MTTGKDNWVKIHWWELFNLINMVKACVDLHLCTISAARPTVHISEKNIKRIIKSGIS